MKRTTIYLRSEEQKMLKDLEQLKKSRSEIIRLSIRFFHKNYTDEHLRKDLEKFYLEEQFKNVDF